MTPTVIVKTQYPRGLFRLLAAAVLVMAAITPVDYSATQLLGRWEWPGLTDFMGRTLFEGERPGANDILVIVLAVALFVYIRSHHATADKQWPKWRPQASFVLLSAFTIAFLLIHCLKLSLGRARPDLVLNHGLPFTHWFSFGPHLLAKGLYRGAFPSGHTAQTFTLMAVAYVLAGTPRASARLKNLGIVAGLAAIALSLTMALARCMSLSHWLTDVIGSIALGWPLMHYLYFSLLRVPDQIRFMKTHDRLPLRLPFWELRMAAYLLVAALGIIFSINALRVVFSGADLLFAPALVPGVFFICFGIIRTRVIHKKLCRALT